MKAFVGVEKSEPLGGLPLSPPEYGFIFSEFSGHADGERRRPGSNRRGGIEKGRGEMRLQVPSDRHGSSAFAVGMLREKERARP